MLKRQFSLLILSVFISIFLCVDIQSHDPNIHNTESALSMAQGVYIASQLALVTEGQELDKLEIQYAMLQVQWDANNKKMTKNQYLRQLSRIKIDLRVVNSTD